MKQYQFTIALMIVCACIPDNCSEKSPSLKRGEEVSIAQEEDQFPPHTDLFKPAPDAERKRLIALLATNPLADKVFSPTHQAANEAARTRSIAQKCIRSVVADTLGSHLPAVLQAIILSYELKESYVARMQRWPLTKLLTQHPGSQEGAHQCDIASIDGTGVVTCIENLYLAVDDTFPLFKKLTLGPEATQVTIASSVCPSFTWGHHTPVIRGGNVHLCVFNNHIAIKKGWGKEEITSIISLTTGKTVGRSLALMNSIDPQPKAQRHKSEGDDGAKVGCESHEVQIRAIDETGSVCIVEEEAEEGEGYARKSWYTVATTTGIVSPLLITKKVSTTGDQAPLYAYAVAADRDAPLGFIEGEVFALDSHKALGSLPEGARPFYVYPHHKGWVAIADGRITEHDPRKGALDRPYDLFTDFPEVRSLGPIITHYNDPRRGFALAHIGKNSHYIENYWRFTQQLYLLRHGYQPLLLDPNPEAGTDFSNVAISDDGTKLAIKEQNSELVVYHINS